MFAVQTVSVSAAQGTAANLELIREYNQNTTLPAVDRGTIEIDPSGNGIKLTIPSTSTNAYPNLNILGTSETGTSETTISSRIVVVDVLPNETITKLQFKARATNPNYEFALSKEIPVSDLKANQWNRLMLVYNAEGSHQLYVNDVLYENTQTGKFGTSLKYANIRFYAHTDKTDGTAYINFNNVKIAKGMPSSNPITSEKYIIEENIIYVSDASTTAGDVLDNITYNATSVVIKGSDGIEKEATDVIERGDTICVYDNDILIRTYQFGKELVSNMSYAFDNDITEGFSGNNATISTISGSSYKKSADDKVMKISATDITKTNYYAQLSTDENDRSKVSTISFEVYPNGTWQSVKIGSTYSNPFLAIPSEKLVQNEWNRITVFVGGDKSIRENTAYVNGKQVFNEGSSVDQIYILKTLDVGTILRLVAMGELAENSSLIVDDFYYAEGVAIVPSLTSQKYIIEDVTINEFKNDTVGDVLNNITHNGSSIKIKNANGVDITNSSETNISSGDHLYIYDGDFVIAHYRFDQPHKAPEIIKEYKDEADFTELTTDAGYKYWGGTITSETGVNGKNSDDASMKLTANTSSVTTGGVGTVYFDSYLFEDLSSSKEVPAFALSFDVYPNDTFDFVNIAAKSSGANYERTLAKVSISDFDLNQWNKVVFVYNPGVDAHTVYVNGKKVDCVEGVNYAWYKEAATWASVRIKAQYTKQDDVTPYVYIDNFQSAYITEIDPRITTNYGIDGSLISGCIGDTVEEVKENITASFGVNVVVKDLSGNVKDDTVLLAEKDNIYIYDGEFVIGHYYVENGKLIIKSPTIITNADGSVTAKTVYTETDGTPRTFNLYIVAYDNEDMIVGVNKTNVPLTTGNDFNEPEEASLESEICADASYFKAFIWDNNCKPLCDSAYKWKADIICWGDSLTFGDGADHLTTSYPAKLAEFTGANVKNMGVGGESAMTIAARMGAYKIYPTEDVIIPKSGSVTFKITSSNGDIALLSKKYGGWNPCTLGGIDGKITDYKVSGTTNPKDLISITFTRDEDGEETYITTETELIVEAQREKADWNIIFVGTNGGWDNDNKTYSEYVNSGSKGEELANLINDMIDNTHFREKCIVIGLAVGNNAEKYENVNATLKKEFGNNFIDIKAYFTDEEKLTNANVVLTEQDIQDIEDGYIPRSLKKNNVLTDLHFNEKGYELLAKLVQEKLNELGFNK